VNGGRRNSLSHNSNPFIPLMDVSDYIPSPDDYAADPRARVNGLKLLFLLDRGERWGLELLDSNEPVYVDQKDTKGRSPLAEAVKKGQVRMMGRLLGLGADPNAQDKQGNTVVMYAVTHGNSTAVELLMKTGLVDVNLVNEAGKRAVDLVEDIYGGSHGYFDSGYVRELLILGEQLYNDYKFQVAVEVKKFFSQYYLAYSEKCLPFPLIDVIIEYLR